MLEESIDASPSNLHRSFSTLRKKHHRKIKRRRLNDESTANFSSNPSVLEFEAEIPNSQLAGMYWDSDDDENAPTTSRLQQKRKLKDSERFKTEQMLASAERSEFNSTRKVYEPSQMFQTCERILETKPAHSPTQYFSCDVQNQSCFDVQTEWLLEPFEEEKQLITAAGVQKNLNATLKNDSALVNLSDNQLDMTLIEDNAKKGKLPTVIAKTSKAQKIIDQILHDFCADLSSEDDKREIGDFEPFFRFRRKKIRTYERCFRRSIVPKNEATNPKRAEDIEISDTSSELSVQEEASQMLPTSEPCDLNTSGAVHNNLLNLSAFFTQNFLENVNNFNVENIENPIAMLVNENPNEVMSNLHKIQETNWIQEILTLRLERKNLLKPFPFGHDDDLYGFASPEECAILSMRTTGQQIESSNEVIACESREEPKTTSKISNDELPVFNEDDFQHDTEFFVNFKTQAVFKTPKSKTETQHSKRRQNENDLEALSSSVKNDTPIKSSKTVILQNVKENPIETEILESQIDVDEVLQMFEKPNIEIIDKVDTKENVDAWKCDFDDMVLSEWILDDVELKDENDKTENISKSPPKLSNTSKNLNKDGVDSVRVNLEDPTTLVDLFNEEDFADETFTQLRVIKEDVKIFKSPPKSPLKSNISPKKLNNNDKNATKEKLEDPNTLVDLFDDNDFWNEDFTQIKAIEKSTKMAEEVCLNAKSNQIKNCPDEAVKNKINEVEKLSPPPTTSHQALILLKSYQESNAAKKNEHVNLNSKNFDMSNAQTTVGAPFVGFCTGNSKVIHIDEAKLEANAKRIFANIPELPLEEENYKTPFKSLKPNIKPTSLTLNMKKEMTHQPTMPTTKDNEKTQINVKNSTISEIKITQTSKLEPFVGFRTGNSKVIHISEEKMQANAKRIFANMPDLPLEENEHKEKPSISNDGKTNLATKTNDEPLIPSQKTDFVGFRTCTYKPITISEQARKKYENFFNEDLNDVKSFNKPNQIQKNQPTQNTKNQEDDYSNIQLSEWLPSSFSPPTSKTPIQNKRKFDKVESSTTATTSEQPAKVLCKSYTVPEKSKTAPESTTITTSFSHVPKTTTASTNELPTSTSKIIVRKNLLSLSKSRKMKLQNQQKSNNINNFNNDETPVKLMPGKHFPHDSTTPNVVDFYGNLPNATSTPQQPSIANVSTPVRTSVLKKNENLDSGFQHINWEQADDSDHICNTPSRTNTSVKPLPSPQERIENLTSSSCGDPPPVPQILNRSNMRCRTLGLSRRARVKK